MVRTGFSFALIAAASICLLGCAEQNGHAPKEHVIIIKPGDNAQKEAQTALINAKPGDIIEFGEGDFHFNQPLSLEDKPGITIRGRGRDKTRLNFKDQLAGAGAEGLLIRSGNFTIQDLTVQDTRGDAIKVEGAGDKLLKGVTFRNVLAEWTRGPHPENGAYGIYPVLCEDVLIENCRVTDCSDAGIYVGQSKNVIIRKSEAEHNVAGIEVENTIGADVYENLSTNNAGGVLVFSLPGLKQKNGSKCRVFNNQIVSNNHANFAKPGNIVATVPSGSGVIIMANNEVEVFDNTIDNHQTSNVSIISYFATNTKFDDPEYDPYPEGIYIHDNRIAHGGDNPQGDFGMLVGPLLKAKAPQLSKFPDIVYDGIVDEKKAKDGKLPPELGVYLSNNGDVTFANIDLMKLVKNEDPNVSTDLAPYAGQPPFKLEPIKIDGVQ